MSIKRTEDVEGQAPLQGEGTSTRESKDRMNIEGGEGLPRKAGSCAHTRMENQILEGFQSESYLQHSSKCESLGPLHFITCSRPSKGRCGLQSPTNFSSRYNNPTLDVTVPGSATPKIQPGHLLFSQLQRAPQRPPCSWHLRSVIPHR